MGAAAGLAAGALGGSLISGFMGSKAQTKAAGRAADAQVEAARIGAGTTLEMYNTGRADLGPYRTSGYGALGRLEGLKLNQPSFTARSGNYFSRPISGGANYVAPGNRQIMGGPGAGGTMIDETGNTVRGGSAPGSVRGGYQPDAGYIYQQRQGEEAINRAMAARGLYGSRAAVNTLSDFNQSLTASDEARQYQRRVDEYNRALGEYNIDYGRAMDEYNTSYNREANLAAMGMGATGQTVSAGQQAGAGLANLYQQSGNAQAQGYLGAGQASSNMWNNLGQGGWNLASLYAMQGSGGKPATGTWRGIA
jgi:hypothetical protein